MSSILQRLLPTLLVTIVLITQTAESTPISLMVSTGNSPCQDPQHSELHSAWVDHHRDLDIHPTWFLLRDMKHAISRQLNQSHEETSFHVDGCRTVDCTSLPPNDVESPLQDRSFCPYYNVINHDPARYPGDLVEARCSCENCAGLGDSSAVCQQIHYNVPVMRRTTRCTNQKLEWERGWQTVSVGCTCAIRPRNS